MFKYEITTIESGKPRVQNVAAFSHTEAMKKLKVKRADVIEIRRV